MKNQENENRDRVSREIPVHIDWYAVTINLLLGGALAMSFMTVGAYFVLCLMK